MSDPNIIQGTGSIINNPGGDWSRGMQSYMLAYDDSGWIRGSAQLNRITGALTTHVQLETDNLSKGPKGVIRVALRDSDGGTLAVVKTEEIGRGGKGPGKAAFTDATSVVDVDPMLLPSIKALYVEATWTGPVDRLFNIDLTNTLNQLKLILEITELGKKAIELNRKRH